MVTPADWEAAGSRRRYAVRGRPHVRADRSVPAGQPAPDTVQCGLRRLGHPARRRRADGVDLGQARRPAGDRRDERRPGARPGRARLAGRREPSARPTVARRPHRARGSCTGRSRCCSSTEPGGRCCSSGRRRRPGSPLRWANTCCGHPAPGEAVERGGRPPAGRGARRTRAGAHRGRRLHLPGRRPDNRTGRARVRPRAGRPGYRPTWRSPPTRPRSPASGGRRRSTWPTSWTGRRPPRSTHPGCPACSGSRSLVCRTSG